MSTFKSLKIVCSFLFICICTQIQSFRQFGLHRTIYKFSHTHNYSHAPDVNRINQLILQETQISREHLTPEIALRLITAECRLYHQPVMPDAEQPFAKDPFWGFYWPGGQAISRYILDNPAAVAGKSVLDVGSGCGASAVAALLSKAKYVVANDIDEAAGCAALINSTLNGITSQLHICVDNLIGSTSVAEDVVLLGDVFYDEEFAAVLLPWLQRLRQQGKHVFVGDPGRHGLTPRRLDLMRKIATYELTENCCIENNGFKFVNVWQLE